MPLSDTAIRKTRPTDKPQKLADGGGLYLLLNPNGSRWWRLRYYVGGKEKLLSLGIYPDVGLKDARDKRDEARKLLAAGIDPGEQRKAAKAAAKKRVANRSEILSHKRLVKRAPTWVRPLEALGIDDAEERVYRALLDHRTVTADEVAKALSLSPRMAQQLLDSIEAKGLVSHSAESARRYIATPPGLAVEALISQRQAVLERARSVIPELQEQALASANTHERAELVEVITSRAALGQILIQLQQTLKTESLCFQRAPAFFLDGPNQGIPADVRSRTIPRTISDESFLALPGAMESLRFAVKMGEETRIFPTLPIKMFIADRRTAIVSLSISDRGSPALLVRAPPLLEAFHALFEHIWERSTPIAFTRTGKLTTGKLDVQLSDAVEQLIPLLAAGLNDKAIAHEAGISGTTLSRRINELMKALDTRTRFQLGWRAAVDAFSKAGATGAEQAPKLR